MVVEHIAALVVHEAVSKALELVKEARAQGRLDRAFEEIKDTILFEMQENFQRIAERVGDLERLSTDRVTRALLLVQLEAVRSPDPERVRMLAAAFAGYFRPDVSLDDRNRALGLVARLEPSDVVLLRAWRDAETRDGTDINPMRVAREYWGPLRDSHHPEVFALISAGCLVVSDGQPVGLTTGVRVGGFPAITPVGDAVIKLLASYVPATTPTPSP